MAPLNIDKILEDERSRRDFLHIAGVAGFGVASSGILAACGGGGSSSTKSGGGSTTTAGKPRRGGVLRVGAQGGGNTDTLEAQNLITNADYARGAQLYDGLARLNEKGKTELVLAESITPNTTATEWTIRLKKGIICHDGKPFTAKDVLYSFKRIRAKKFPGAILLGPIDLNASRAVDARTVLLKFKQPYSILIDCLGIIYCYMVPEGYDPKKPIGTGPFKLKSFTPGRESTVVRHTQYFDPSLPYLDKIVTTNINDETAQVNALQSGQVDAIDYLSAASIAALSNGQNKVIVSKTGGWGPFTLMSDRTPFADDRVRLAMKLVIDRPGMLEQVFSGKGAVGNDVFGIFDKNFDPKLLPQRHQDIEKAKSLLKSAGHSDLRVQLVTTPNGPGQVRAAEVYKTDAAAAGIKVNVVNQSPTDYFARSYLKVPFSQDYWPYLPYLVTVPQATVPGAPFNFTHFNDPTYTKLFKKAAATTDAATQREAVHEMLKIDYDKGGYIIPYYFPVIDAVSSKVQGVEQSVTGQALSSFNFKKFWLSA
jgi:peptide/nickel transport system substrate-binding protein